jgi:hypothetical protein
VADIKDVPLDIDTAIPCGLIINELISNSFYLTTFISHFQNGRG